MPGEKYEVKIVMYNSSINATEILIIQQDYLFDGEHRLLKCGKVERSNCSWIEVKHTRMLLLGQRKEALIFRVTVPDDASPGSYHSILAIKTKPANMKENPQVSVSLATKINVQIVSNVDSEKAKTELKIIKTKVKDDKLFLTIKNMGQKVLTFEIKVPIPGIESGKKARIYPDQQQTIELTISDLKDGEYKQLRFLLDDGKIFIQPVFVTFRKGELPEKAPLYVLTGEEIRKKRGRAKASRALRVNALLSYGTNYRSLSLTGSFNLFNNIIRVSGGSSYREWQTWISDEMLTYRGGLSLNLKKLRLNYSAYFFEHNIFEMVSGNYHHKNLSINANYLLDREVLQANISQRFWKKWSIRLSTFFDFKTQRRRGVVSLSIPII